MFVKSVKYCNLVDTSLTSLQPWRNENSLFGKKSTKHCYEEKFLLKSYINDDQVQKREDGPQSQNIWIENGMKDQLEGSLTSGTKTLRKEKGKRVELVGLMSNTTRYTWPWPISRPDCELGGTAAGEGEKRTCNRWRDEKKGNREV